MAKRTPQKRGRGKTQAIAGGPTGKIMLYQAPDGAVTLDVRLERESIWLNQKQMAELFDTERSVITKHLRNIFKSGELAKNSVSAFFAHTAEDAKTYQVEFYNLDAIISVGYRVNSKRGTQFRIWATHVLRDHIFRGYTVNTQRLEQLQQAIRLVARVTDYRRLTGEEAAGLLRVVSEYSYALSLLDDYDHGRLPEASGMPARAEPIAPEEARRLVTVLRKEFGGSTLFGQERPGGALESSLAAVFQTAIEQDLYPTIEEKATQLLYFLVKNHPFVDGNKRIGAALFLWFLEKNRALTGPDGRRRLSEESLVALTLLIAESAPAEKDTLIRVSVALLNGPPSDGEESP